MFLIGVLICALIFYSIDAVHVGNLLEIEFSKDYQIFRDLTIRHKKNVLINNHWFDFVFIIIYSLLFVSSYKLAVFEMQVKPTKWGILLCTLPGIFDCLENIIFLRLINEECRAYFYDYKSFVRIKWALSIFFIQIVMAILLFQILYHLSKKSKKGTFKTFFLGFFQQIFVILGFKKIF